MLKILLFMVLALVATVPSVLIARFWLRRQGIDPGDNTVQTFMSHAPGAMKAALISLNFIMFAFLCGGGWTALSLLE